MKKTYKSIIVIGTAALLGLTVASFASAMSFTSNDHNITIADGQLDPSQPGMGQAGEDNEVEPGAILRQPWDLEGFFQEGWELGMVGGYNFKVGNNTVTSGDIFLSTVGSFDELGVGVANTVKGNQLVTDNYGYEYVIDLDFDTSTYEVYELTQNSKLWTGSKPIHASSNPWQYNHDDNPNDVSIASGQFNFLAGVDAPIFDGNTHYAVTGISLTFLGDHTDFYSHFTMGCGNDNLLGRGMTPAPEPATMLLFGAGIAGLASRRYSRKK